MRLDISHPRLSVEIQWRTPQMRLLISGLRVKSEFHEHNFSFPLQHQKWHFRVNAMYELTSRQTDQCNDQLLKKTTPKKL